MTYAIKVRRLGERAWWFLTPNGGMIRLKVHAGRYEAKEKAEAQRDYVLANNAEVEAKVVPL